MKVITLNREDLNDSVKNKHIDKLKITDFGSQQYHDLKNADEIVFVDKDNKKRIFKKN